MTARIPAGASSLPEPSGAAWDAAVEANAAKLFGW